MNETAKYDKNYNPVSLAVTADSNQYTTMWPSNAAGDALLVELTNAPGGLNYLGTWDASINSPAITSGVGSNGDYYLVSVAGTTDIDGFSDWEVGDWIIFNGTTWQEIDNQQSIPEQYILIKWADLRDLMGGGSLIPGATYVIEDFQTIYARPDYDSTGNIKSTLDIVAGPVEPLAVQALSPYKISSTAKSLYYPNDIIEYDIDVITTFDYGGQTNFGYCKGRINYRKDTNNNEADFDLRVVTFVRYTTPSNPFVYESIYDNGNTPGLFPMFNLARALNNKSEGLYALRNDLVMEFPNIVIVGNATDNKFGTYSYNLTFTQSAQSVVNTGVLSENIMLQSVAYFTNSGRCSSNTFNVEFLRSSVSGNLIQNAFWGSRIDFLDVSGSMNGNVMYCEISGMKVSGIFETNEFATTSAPLIRNTFSGTFSDNFVYHSTFENNIFSGNFTGCTISTVDSTFKGNNVFGNIYGATFYASTYGFNDNAFGGLITNSEFYSCVNNNFVAKITDSVFGNDLPTIAVTDNNVTGEIETFTCSNNFSLNTISGMVKTVSCGTMRACVISGAFRQITSNQLMNYVALVIPNDFGVNAITTNTTSSNNTISSMTLSGDCLNKTLTVALYPVLFGGNNYGKSVIKGTNGSNYLRSFNGTVDVTTLIV